MKALFTSAFVLGVAGCSSSNESAAIEVCEASLMEELRSPSTYSRQDVTVGIKPANVNSRQIFIKYDAANAFGTPVRGLTSCIFEVDDTGQFPSRTSLEVQASRSYLDNMEANGDIGPVPECCGTIEMRRKHGEAAYGL